jgi:hypothetical protein
LSAYCKDPDKYIARCKEEAEYELSDELYESFVKDGAIKNQHKAILEQKALLTKLRNMLLNSLEQYENDFTGEEPNSNNSEKLSPLEYFLSDEEMGIDNVTSYSAERYVDDLLVPYGILYKWFKRFSIEVEEWESIDTFKKQNLEDIFSPKHLRTGENSTDFDLKVYAALLVDLAKDKEHDRKKLLKANGKVKVSVVSEYLSTSFDVKSASSVRDSLDKLIDFIPQRRINKTTNS